MSWDWVLDAQPPTLEPTPTPSVSVTLSSQVRMAILRIIGQLALSGFQDRIKGWGLKYVSIQLTLSTYKLVSGPGMQTMEQVDFGNKWFPKCWRKNVPELELYAYMSLTQVCRHSEL